MSRRPVNPVPRRLVESDVNESVGSSIHHKSKSPSLLSICLVLLAALLLIVYSFSGSGLRKKDVAVRDSSWGNDDELDLEDKGDKSSRPECRTIACRAIPLLQEVYGNAMNRILHIGPGTCGLVLKLIREEKLEAWGIQPFDLRPPVHSLCENIVRKGLVRVADVFRPLPYKRNSFSLVIVTDTVEAITSKQLNVTLPELVRIAEDGVVLIISAKPVQRMVDQVDQTGKIPKPIKPRNKMWWHKRFQMLGLRENEAITKNFDYLQSKKSFRPNYYIFHLMS